MFSLLRPAPLCAALLLCSIRPDAQAHQHFYAGATDTNNNGIVGAGDKLNLQGVHTTGLVFHLEARPAGRVYGGYYSLSANIDALYPKQYPLDAFTFAALATESENYLAEDGHAAENSFLVMEITSVTGPAGGQLSFWNSFVYSAPSYTFTIGQSVGGYRFNLTDPVEGDPGNPYGHIHERAWSIDLAHPGTYTIGFTLYDTSSAGPGGGPIHLPSDTYYFSFQTVPLPEPGSAILILAGGSIAAAWRRRP